MKNKYKITNYAYVALAHWWINLYSNPVPIDVSSNSVWGHKFAFLYLPGDWWLIEIVDAIMGQVPKDVISYPLIF